MVSPGVLEFEVSRDHFQSLPCTYEPLAFELLAAAAPQTNPQLVHAGRLVRDNDSQQYCPGDVGRAIQFPIVDEYGLPTWCTSLCRASSTAPSATSLDVSQIPSARS